MLTSLKQSKPDTGRVISDMLPVMHTYLEFEVSLLDIDPRIWRRFQLGVGDTFDDLHSAIQNSFDWDGDHMWAFEAAGRDRRTLAGPGAFDLGYESHEIPDAWDVKLTQHFRRVSMTCRYTYDFGDCWVHAVKLRRRVTNAERFHRRLVAGSRAAPKEDSGGIGGYWRMVEMVESGNDAGGWEPGEKPSWIDTWKPDQFDLATEKAAFDK